MGIVLKTVSLKWDAETIQAADTLLEMFSPFVEGRSQLSRLVFKMFLKIVRTQGMLEVLVASLQGLQGNTSSHQLPKEFPAAFPGAGNQAGSDTSLGPRLDKRPISRLVAASVLELGTVAWFSPLFRTRTCLRGSLA